MQQTISFGTEGWRGVIGKDFTLANVCIVAQAYADFLTAKHDDNATAVVGYDARFMSEEYAHDFAKVLAANGVNVFLCKSMVATPVLSFAVKTLDAHGGIMITASHNPPKYNGVKFKGSFGGPENEDTVKEISSYLYRSPIRSIPLPGRMALYSPDEEYLEALDQLVDAKKIKKARMRIVLDAMHGSGSSYIARFLLRHGIEHKIIRADANPTFGGVNPEPIEANLAALKKAVHEYNAQTGLATDGDGDRIGAIDRDGSFINAQQIYAIILKYCLGKKILENGVGKTFSTTCMIDKIATNKGKQVFETPVGFKHLAKLFLTKEISIGGEESGGIGIKIHIPERDGILNALLLLEYMSETGKTLKTHVQELFKEIGPHYYNRIDMPFESEDNTKLCDALINYGFPWRTSQLSLKTLDGVKWTWPDSSWLLFRPSGTEPMMRIYAEADNPETVNTLLENGKKLAQSLET